MSDGQPDFKNNFSYCYKFNVFMVTLTRFITVTYIVEIGNNQKLFPILCFLLYYKTSRYSIKFWGMTQL